MAEFEFDLVFALPDGRHDALALSDAIYAAGFEDAVVGSGKAGLLAVSLEHEGDEAEGTILEVAQAILAKLPEGSSLREVRPDLVSLADVATRLKVKRQTLQQREMPKPAVGGLYRVTEIAEVLILQHATAARKPRFDPDTARGWFAAGLGAQTLNAHLALRALDPSTLRKKKDEAVGEQRVH